MSFQARILVLEDDSIMLELLCEALEGAGYEARGAGRPEQAVEMARKIPFEMVISDIRMGGPTDGLGAIAEAAGARPRLLDLAWLREVVGDRSPPSILKWRATLRPDRG